MLHVVRCIFCLLWPALATLALGQSLPTATSSGPVGADCLRAVLDDKWAHQSFPAQRGVFTVEFDATPAPAGTRSAIILSDGPSGGKTKTPVMILFEDKANLIQLRTANRYAADKGIKYTAGAAHHFRIVVDVPQQTYSVYVTVPGQAEQAVGVNYAFAKNYAFGKEQPAATELNRFGVSVKGDQVQPESATNLACKLVVRAGQPAQAVSRANDTRVLIGNRMPVTVEQLDASKAAGFDFAEFSLATIGDMTDEQFARLREHAQKINLPIRVGALLTAGKLHAVGVNLDPAKQLELVGARLDRAAALGAQIVTFGAVGDLPDGTPREEARRQLITFSKMAAREAARRKLTLALLPIEPGQGRHVTTTTEALSVIEAVNEPNLKLSVDLHHLVNAGEKPDAVRAIGARLSHVSVANPKERALPLDAREYDYAAFFAVLNAIEYRGLITIFAKGAGTKEYADNVPKAVAFVRQAAARPGRR